MSVRLKFPRARTGDLEADLMSFSKPGQHLLVLHERKSRKTFLVRQETKTAQTVVDNIGAALETFPLPSLFSMTFDNGSEFSKHYLLREKFGITTWFCDTHSPWQKGGVENAIGRLRRMLPRRTDLDTLEKQSLVKYIDRYNNMPRKCLGFKTPNEVFLENGVALET